MTERVWPPKVGQRVRATRQVTEDGKGLGDPKAVWADHRFPDNFIHAEKGEFGTVVCDDGNPTVFFDGKGTGTSVISHEVEIVDFKAEDFMNGFLRWWKEVDCDQSLSDFDLALGWFSAKGCSHDEALRGAEMVRDQHKGRP